MTSVTILDSPVVPFPALPAVWTVAEAQKHLGDIPADRILILPSLGGATVNDVERIRATGRICELVDGILVEKTVGWYESRLAIILGQIIQNYLDKEQYRHGARGGTAHWKSFPIWYGLPTFRISLGRDFLAANFQKSQFQSSFRTWRRRFSPKAIRPPR